MIKSTPTVTFNSTQSNTANTNKTQPITRQQQQQQPIQTSTNSSRLFRPKPDFESIEGLKTKVELKSTDKLDSLGVNDDAMNNSSHAKLALTTTASKQNENSIDRSNLDEYYETNEFYDDDKTQN